VGDVLDSGVDKTAPATIYFRAGVQGGVPGFPSYVPRALTFAIRSDRTGKESFLKELRAAVYSVNPTLPLASIRTLKTVYDRSLARTSFTLVMLAISSAMALLLGIIGIYGVVSYAVSQRTREIGIRLALGSKAGELKRMFVRNALVLAGIGVVIGLGAAAGLTRLMKSLLFGISSLDPLTYVLVPGVLVAAAVFASYLPARRVARVDPNEALRVE
jgi:ABC-type antimicrobial peptide transport system permease subunit